MHDRGGGHFALVFLAVVVMAVVLLEQNQPFRARGQSSSPSPSTPPRSTEAVTPVETTPQIAKRHVCGNMRHVFCAGVEGTGHHLWVSLWHICPPSMCTPHTRASIALARLHAAGQGGKFTGDPEAMGSAFEDMLIRGPGGIAGTAKSTTSGRRRAGNATSSDPTRTVTCNPDTARQSSEGEKESTEGASSPPRLLVLNTYDAGTGAGMLSYPNFKGTNKATQHPDIVDLAIRTERLGLDLRIIVIVRHPYEIMV